MQSIAMLSATGARHSFFARRSFSQSKLRHRLRRTGAGRARRGAAEPAVNTVTMGAAPTEPEWRGLGWSPLLFLGVAPAIAWVGVVLVSPDLRRDLYKLLGYADVREATVAHSEESDAKAEGTVESN